MISYVLDGLNGSLILLYGILLTVRFAGGYNTPKERRFLIIMSIVIWFAQILSWSFWGLKITSQLYPLITHLPITLILVLVLKKTWGVAIVSMLTAYFCCQLIRWIGTMFLCLFGTSLAYQLGYLISIFPVYFLLRKYFYMSVHQAMTYSSRSLLLFGGLPLSYYLFDYATTIYSKALYDSMPLIIEFLPAAMVLFYVFFVSAYHTEVQQRNQVELQNSLLIMQFEQVKKDVFASQQMQEQTAAYRHDMRHHFVMIDGYLRTGDAGKACKYIQSAVNDIERITPVRYCANVAVNLILSAYAARAKKLGVELSIEANIPDTLPSSDTELTALLSNGIENAVSAAAQCREEREKIVRINCQMHKGNLLIYIKNPYEGKITMLDGLPQSNRSGHGFGTKSIKLIAEMHGGGCFFEAEDGLFILKVVLPLEK